MSKSTSTRRPVRILAADHTGITVSNLERSLAFWRDVLGFELSHHAHQTGEMASEITGVAGAELKLAVLKTSAVIKLNCLNTSPQPTADDMAISGHATSDTYTSRSSSMISTQF